jgi:hypothetical protein
MSQYPDENPAPDDSRAIDQLQAQSKRLKERIEEEKRRHDMPVDSHLGDPNWEERAKDGHLDLPPDEDE